MIRIVREPGGNVALDRTGRRAGRGAYLCGAKECLASAIKHKKLGRALRCEIPGSVITELESLVVTDDDGK